MLPSAFINGYGWIPVISASAAPPRSTSATASLRSIYVVIAACRHPPASTPAHSPSPATRRSASPPTTPAGTEPAAPASAPLILDWVGALAVTVQASLILYHWDDIPARIFISPVARRALRSIFTVFWFLGDSRRMRELAAKEFKERARRLEYEQEQERRLAAQANAPALPAKCTILWHTHCPALFLRRMGRATPPRAPAPHAHSKQRSRQSRTEQVEQPVKLSCRANRTLRSRP